MAKLTIALAAAARITAGCDDAALDRVVSCHENIYQTDDQCEQGSQYLACIEEQGCCEWRDEYMDTTLGEEHAEQYNRDGCSLKCINTGMSEEVPEGEEEGGFEFGIPTALGIVAAIAGGGWRLYKMRTRNAGGGNVTPATTPTPGAGAIWKNSAGAHFDGNCVHLPNVNSSKQTHEVQAWYSHNLDGLASATLTANWKDQGWGNQKGAIQARVATAGGQEIIPWRRVGPHPAPHNLTKVDIEMPREFFEGMPADAQLQLGFEVGGGGGHSLHISDARLTPLQKRAVAVLEDAEDIPVAVAVPCEVVEDAQGGSRFCSTCGTALKPGAGFCGECGSKFQGAGTVAAAAPTEPE